MQFDCLAIERLRIHCLSDLPNRVKSSRLASTQLSKSTTDQRSASQLAKLPTTNYNPTIDNRSLAGGALLDQPTCPQGPGERERDSDCESPVKGCEPQGRRNIRLNRLSITVTPCHTATPQLLLLRAYPCLRPNGLECLKAEGAEGPSCVRMSRMSTKCTYRQGCWIVAIKMNRQGSYVGDKNEQGSDCWRSK